MPKTSTTVKPNDWEVRRKQRTRELIQLGGLCDIAGLMGVDRAALLGMLITGKRMLDDVPTYENFFRLGVQVFKVREEEKKTKR